MSSARIRSLEERLNVLHEAHRVTLQLINRLANLKFQPGSLSLDNEEGNIRTELTTEIHENLKKEDEELEILKQEVQDTAESSARRDARKEQEQKRLTVQVARIVDDFKIARSRFRTAQVQSKRNAALARAQERDLLFSSKSESDDAVIRRRNERTKGGQDEAVAASGDVTAALRRTQKLLQTEIQRSHFAQEIFNQSSEAIKQLSESYNDLDSLLSSSKTLLTTLVKSNKSDTWYLETTVYLLLATIGWLFFRRFIYGPSWWLIYLPLRLAYRTVFTALGIVGIKARTAAISETASSISQPSIYTQASGMMADQSIQARDGHPESGQELPLSDKIADMVEKSEKPEKVIRGDGTVLEHSDAPRNPKKRVFEVKDDERKTEQQEQAKVDQQVKDEL
jgi:protein transport protein SEC20